MNPTFSDFCNGKDLIELYIIILAWINYIFLRGGGVAKLYFSHDKSAIPNTIQLWLKFRDC